MTAPDAGTMRAALEAAMREGIEMAERIHRFDGVVLSIGLSSPTASTNDAIRAPLEMARIVRSIHSSDVIADATKDATLRRTNSRRGGPRGEP